MILQATNNDQHAALIEHDIYAMQKRMKDLCPKAMQALRKGTNARMKAAAKTREAARAEDQAMIRIKREIKLKETAIAESKAKTAAERAVAANKLIELKAKKLSFEEAKQKTVAHTENLRAHAAASVMQHLQNVMCMGTRRHTGKLDNLK